MKKKYIKPSAKIVEMKHGASILAGSLYGSVDGQQSSIQYGGDTSDANKDNDGITWGD